MKSPDYAQMPTNWSNEQVIEAAQKFVDGVVKYAFCNEFCNEITRADIKSRLFNKMSTPDLAQETEIQGVRDSIDNFINSSKILEYLDMHDAGTYKYGFAVKLDSDFMTGDLSPVLGCVKIQFMLLRFEKDKMFDDRKSPKLIVEEGKMYFATNSAAPKTIKFEALPVFENFVQLSLNGSDIPVDRY